MKIYRSKGILAGLLLASTTLICACKKEETKFDVTGDKFSRVYLKSATNLSFAIVNTPVGTIGNVNAAIPVFVTMPATAALKVSFTIDNSLVESFNTKNGTGYKTLPDGLVNLTAASATIPTGQQVSSDSLKVTIPADKLPQLTEKAYLLPLKIAAVAGDAAAQVSTNQNTVYIIVNTSKSSLYDRPQAADMTGSIITDRSKWTASIDQPIQFGSAADIFDGNDQSYFFINSAKSVFTVDLGETIQGIQGIRLKSYFDFYGITSAEVSFSTDGVTWTDYGTANLATGIGAQYIKPYGTVNARYVRLEITGWQNNFIAPVEFDLYK